MKNLVVCVLIFSATLSNSSSAIEEKFLSTPSGSTIVVKLHANFDSAEWTDIRTWLSANINAVSTLYGDYPYPNAPIHIVRYRSRSWRPEPRAAVPWGVVTRANPTRVEFHIVTKHPLKQFLEDWTPTHEMSHLFIPNPGKDHRWMGEGLASYMQNILRARSGMQSQKTAWRKIYEGFQRGLDEHRNDPITLTQASRRKYGRGRSSIMRVHWGGVAFYLNADIELRRQSGGRQSLATVLKKMRDCCLVRNQKMNGGKLVRLYDELSGTTVFTDLYKKYTTQTSFPEFRTALSALGISVVNDKVVLGGNSDQVALRDSISGFGVIN
jgi:hypothetical protein